MIFDKRKKLFIALSSIVILLSVAYFFLTKESVSVAVYGPGENMDRDFAVKFNWTVGDSEFKFSRDEVNEDWSPTVNPDRVRERIWSLPFNNVSAMKLPNGKRITVEVQFAHKADVWIGAWSEGIFVWQDGPFKGMGRKLTDEQNQFFEAGKFSFEDRKIDWCKSRIKCLSNWNDQTWESVKGEWFFTDKNSKTTKAKGQVLESWMGSNCRIQVDQFVDPDVTSPNMLLANKMQVSFEKALPISFSLHETGVFKLSNIYFRSTSFEKALKELDIQ